MSGTSCRLTAAAIALAIGLVIGLAIGLSACGDDDGVGPDDRPVPAVAQIAVAVDALEHELDGPQEFFEINADDRLVNLFVATDGGATATPYLFLDGEIQPPGPAGPAEGSTLTAGDVDVDADRVLGEVADELPDSALTTFVITVGPNDVVRYEVLARSPRGGTLAVEVTGDGAIVGVESL